MPLINWKWGDYFSLWELRYCFVVCEITNICLRCHMSVCCHNELMTLRCAFSYVLDVTKQNMFWMLIMCCSLQLTFLPPNTTATYFDPLFYPLFSLLSSRTRIETVVFYPGLEWGITRIGWRTRIHSILTWNETSCGKNPLLPNEAWDCSSEGTCLLARRVVFL